MPSTSTLLLALLATAKDVAAAVAPIDPDTGLPKRPVAGHIPALIPAVIALLCFGTLALIQWIHLARMGRKFMLVLSIGTTAMAVGFVMRIMVREKPYSLMVYIIEQFFILLSPCAFLAADYMLLTRISARLGHDIAEDCLLLSPRRLVRIFIISDVVTFWIQACGGGTSAAGGNIALIGQNVALAGLILQLISFSLFTTVLIIFGLRVRSRYPSSWSLPKPYIPEPSLFKFWATTPIENWKVLYYAVCYSCIGILIRGAFRIVEYAQGYDGYLRTHEAFFYLLDSIPLFLAMAVYVFIWPTRFVGDGRPVEKEGFELVKGRSQETA